MPDNHSAPGPMAGYLFQLERAVAWLAKSPASSRIGIETGDDIVAVTPAAEIREQDKHSISEARTPLGDTSKELWSTLFIWLTALTQGTVRRDLVRFYIVTNKAIPASSLVRRISNVDTNTAALTCVRELRTIGAEITGAIKPLVLKVLAFPDPEIALCLRQVELVDGSAASAGSALLDQIASDLHLPASFDKVEFHRSLIGWVYEMVMQLWRNGQPAWITRESFDQHAQTLRLRLADRKIRERARHLLPLPAIDPAKHQDRNFVRQIQLVSDSDEDATIIEAVEDFLGASGERIRLSQEGNLTKDDLISFDNRLHTRWKTIFAREKRTAKGTDPKQSKDTGAQIMSETLDHRESLAGQPTEEYYLTRGSYHALADDLKVGWHPDYESRLKDEQQ